MVIDLSKEGFGPDAELEISSKVSMNSPEEKKFIGTILEVKNENITADFNHPLAGKNLIFTVTIASIK